MFRLFTPSKRFSPSYQRRCLLPRSRACAPTPWVLLASHLACVAADALAPLVSPIFPAIAAHPAHTHTPRESAHVAPHDPSSFLSLAHTRPLSPASFHSPTALLVYNRHRPSLMVMRARRVDPPGAPDIALSFQSVHPR
jgi:hypothetical protein